MKDSPNRVSDTLKALQFAGHVSRRAVIAAPFAGAMLAALARAEEKRPRRILLRSSWQTVNIGDIAHTPGVLRLLAEHLPDVEVRLWPSKVDNGVEEMLNKRFPKVAIVKGAAGLKAAFEECDFLLHGSGPSLVAEKDVIKWREQIKKPYGVYGITQGTLTEQTIDVLSNARFVFFRDSVSLKLAQEKGVKCPIMAFGPDGAFGTDLRDDASAGAFLKANGLEEGKFLCVIPRYRYTPYWKIHDKAMTAEDERRWKISQQMKEHDNAPLREAIIAVARQTQLKILVCPEDQSQMALGKEILVDPLPADVKAKVAWREKYWLTDEAISTYVKSAGLFGLEMHSPIMCIGNGVPAIVCRFKEQTSKGFMWRDIGLADWLFDMDEPKEVEAIVPAVVALAKDPAAARARAVRALEFVKKRQAETMAEVGRAAGLG